MQRSNVSGECSSTMFERQFVTASQLVNFPPPRISTRVPGAISEVPSLQPPAPQGPVASSYPPPTATRWCPFAPGNWGHLDPPSGSTCLTCPFQSLKQQVMSEGASTTMSEGASHSKIWWAHGGLMSCNSHQFTVFTYAGC